MLTVGRLLSLSDDINCQEVSIHNLILQLHIYVSQSDLCLFSIFVCVHRESDLRARITLYDEFSAGITHIVTAGDSAVRV